VTGEHALPASVEDVPILGDTTSAVVSGKMSPIPDSFVSAASNTTQSDNRSPLERFRTAPKKALSVTDLVSPAWCELQYYYTLSIHGRKIRTAAMKKGSVVHKELEDQIYTTVQVDITCKEEAWGLRIWNVIQGLKTLRETGQARELEVWGLVEGQIVNGVILLTRWHMHARTKSSKHRASGNQIVRSRH
jgi:hypothetical protein